MPTGSQTVTDGWNMQLSGWPWNTPASISYRTPPRARRVLILGEGDGRFLARLLRCNRNACIAVLESSGRMIQLARSRVTPGDRSRVEFHQVDAVAHSLPAGPFDCVVSHFFLDILNCRDAEAVIGKVSTLLSPGASWLVTEFQEPPGEARRAACSPMARCNVWFLLNDYRTARFQASALSQNAGTTAGWLKWTIGNADLA